MAACIYDSVIDCPEDQNAENFEEKCRKCLIRESFQSKGCGSMDW